MEKIVKEFASMYGKALIACGNQAADVKITAFTNSWSRCMPQTYSSSIMSILPWV